MKGHVTYNSSGFILLVDQTYDLLRIGESSSLTVDCENCPSVVIKTRVC